MSGSAKPAPLKGVLKRTLGVQRPRKYLEIIFQIKPSKL
jgi:hypothetical protein